MYLFLIIYCCILMSLLESFEASIASLKALHEAMASFFLVSSTVESVVVEIPGVPNVARVVEKRSLE